MASLRVTRLLRLCSALAVATATVSFLLFVVASAPLSAKKTEPIEKKVTSPVRLALTHQGELLLSDYRSQSVLIIDPDSLDVLRTIKIKGRPTGVNADGNRIYVGNESTASIEVYGRNGKLKTTLAEGDVVLPNDIAIDHATGQLFVVDAAAKKVRVFDKNGAVAGDIPTAGVSQRLIAPTALTIDQNAQLVYVSDQGPSSDSLTFSNRDARVHIYRYDGSYVDTLSGSFSRPQGLTLNPDGYLYLADGVRGQVLVYDLLGKTLVKTIGTPGTGPGQLSLPLDVLIRPGSEDLLVANNRAGRLELFVGGGVAP